MESVGARSVLLIVVKAYKRPREEFRSVVSDILVSKAETSRICPLF